MKTYKTIEEWLKSSPSEQLINNVLTFVNRKQATELRRTVWQKKLELRRLERIEKAMVKMKLNGEEVVGKIEALKSEVAKLEKLIPVKPPKK